MGTRARSSVPRRPDPRVGRAARRRPSIVGGWTSLPWAIRVLRAFLGVTFLFAGAQKLLDPNFLHAGSPDFVGTQLRGFAQGTPAGPLLSVLAHAPVLTGLGIALVEIAIGLGTLLGVAVISCAVAGLAINVTLWLSATWHVHPYFLGSDSIYAVAWVALLLALLEAERARRGGRIAGPIERIDGLGRREFVRGGVVAGAALLIATAADAFAGTPVSKRGLARATRAPRSPSPAIDGPTTGATGASTRTVPGKVLTTLDRLPVGRAVGFEDPGVGPAVLLRLANGQVVAYSRVCTHAGCIVGYDASSEILVCPCHGAEFDPAHRATPIAGPTSVPLTAIRVVVDRSTGEVILPA